MKFPAENDEMKAEMHRFSPHKVQQSWNRDTKTHCFETNYGCKA